MEGILSSIKGMFVKEDGGIKWASIIGIAAGAAIGGFLLPELLPEMLGGMPVIAGVGGALVGLMGAQVIGGMGGDSAQASASPGAGGVAVKPPQHGQEHHQAHGGPGAIPRGNPNPRPPGGRGSSLGA